ncbi:Drf-FH1 multi-domain protein [Pyrenophora tritici-repentis]|uniref:Drf-FH1 multi-domain protein n=2 Tax=Pyrenophora tritici-repentis TaxID=45151 RepID=A0A317AAM4_9PLEO|nr:Drf-FH1 multi-domain protein [Pyrenophora tritici-repentis]PWO19512.1 hypothetical protein PtrARCrB10_11986 [Pyrenophora tritici-repentis]
MEWARRERACMASESNPAGPTTGFTFVSAPNELKFLDWQATYRFTFGGENSMNGLPSGYVPPPAGAMNPPFTPFPGATQLPPLIPRGPPSSGFMGAPPPRPMGPPPPRPATGIRPSFMGTNTAPSITTPAPQVPPAPLLYNSPAAAEVAQHARNLQWPPRGNDPTFPRTDRERVQYVQRLVTAMKDITSARDLPSGTAFKKRWLNSQSQGHYGYPLESFELASWGILKATERLHTYGLASLNI